MADTPDSKMMGAKKMNAAGGGGGNKAANMAPRHPHTPQRSPRSERLRGRGIGGLSFEELSTAGSKSPGGGTPNKYLSFEQAG
jgi:hypothetical protein